MVNRTPIINNIYSLKYNEVNIELNAIPNFIKYIPKEKLGIMKDITLSKYIYGKKSERSNNWIDNIDSLHNAPVQQLKSKAQNIELLLLLRYYRFIKKGSELEVKPIWFLSNDELHSCWNSVNTNFLCDGINEKDSLNYCSPKNKT